MADKGRNQQHLNTTDYTLLSFLSPIWEHHPTMCQLIVLTYCCARHVLGRGYVGNLQFYSLPLRKAIRVSARKSNEACFQKGSWNSLVYTSCRNAVFKNSTVTIGCLLYILTATLEDYLFFKCCKTRVKISVKSKQNSHLLLLSNFSNVIA